TNAGLPRVRANTGCWCEPPTAAARLRLLNTHLPHRAARRATTARLSPPPRNEVLTRRIDVGGRACPCPSRAKRDVSHGASYDPGSGPVIVLRTIRAGTSPSPTEITATLRADKKVLDPRIGSRVYNVWVSQQANSNIYLRSSELAAHAGVSTDTLRHYERKGLIPAPRRSQNNYREYSA